MANKTFEPTMVPTETDLAWAAGIFDGEGCVLVRHDAQSVKKGWTRHELQVSVVNTNEPMIRKLIAMFGGGAHVRKVKVNRRIGMWQIYGRRAAGFLENILPYMVAKKPEAEAALEMASTLVAKTSYNANSGLGAPRPGPEIVEIREAVRLRLQELKRVEYEFDLSDLRMEIA
jgi:hypothetical protein